MTERSREERTELTCGQPKREGQCLNCQAAFQCAPVLLGIKPSNLLIIDSGSLPEACRLLQDTSVRITVLFGSWKRNSQGGKIVLFVYRPELVDPILRDQRAGEFLESLGYQEKRLDLMLGRLKERYAGCMEKRLPFPHELGVLLGYPLEDVKGFMKYKGENFLCSGYWKVYSNENEAKRTFRLYDAVRRDLSCLAGQGMAVSEAVKCLRAGRLKELAAG